MDNSQDGYCFSFPAVRGIQAGKPFYIATCPLSTIPKIFVFDEEEVPPELRAQRTLNKSRIPEMVRYLVENPKDYVFSALTVSVASSVHFEENDHLKTPNLGTLKVPMDAQILINDGQHRRAAIEAAIKEQPEIAHDNIPVLFFVDEGLKRSQQMFADLNKYAVKPSPSLAALYDSRDESAELARYLAQSIKPFEGFTEMEKSSISSKSGKLFTLSSLKQANRALLSKGPKDSFSEEEKQLASDYWQAVFAATPEWQMVINKELAPSQFRLDYVHAHGVGLHALGSLGSALITAQPNHWKETIKLLKNVDWRKANPVWANRSMLHGKLSKASTNITLTTNALKQCLSLPLTPDERALENQHIPHNEASNG
ncbi:DNA sulfur modification protein DndB [Shewanella sp. 1_MG-2023]|uniref:DNA sulfur modification protein DndB n=1 Tax=unclassified Shewanella TaxID=196818 RepID=UPI0026E40734|nr:MULTISPECIES: DNA sulfur modification protein DndB [unclassified Shewanella]MDO6610514.1 DNA sulfur modification protein DndB [Shewanella sp. 7_MG-2023]MDO6770639.1 DNA sulfur modification protein DndB [Shewanella sp. 2_MG-2023]MDO6795025.1 DNA sulfur modification protein DndB [Shewanella sp. 1_MG-2023]